MLFKYCIVSFDTVLHNDIDNNVFVALCVIRPGSLMVGVYSSKSLVPTK